MSKKQITINPSKVTMPQEISKPNEILEDFSYLAKQFSKQIVKKTSRLAFRHTKMVSVFSRFDAHDILMENKQSMLPFSQYSFNYTQEQADVFINQMIDYGVIVGAELYDSNNYRYNEKFNEKLPYSAQKEKFNISKYVECDISMKKDINVFILMKNPLDINLILYTAVSIVLILFLSSFKIWPDSIKGKTHYVFYGLLGFTAFLFFLGVIRLIFFVITYFIDFPGTWIFPNLFADVGFFESFVPLYERASVTSFQEKNK